jgi:hypothetical protein
MEESRINFSNMAEGSKGAIFQPPSQSGSESAADPLRTMSWEDDAVDLLGSADSWEESVRSASPSPAQSHASDAQHVDSFESEGLDASDVSSAATDPAARILAKQAQSVEPVFIDEAVSDATEEEPANEKASDASMSAGSFRERSLSSSSDENSNSDAAAQRRKAMAAEVARAVLGRTMDLSLVVSDNGDKDEDAAADNDGAKSLSLSNSAARKRRAMAAQVARAVLGGTMQVSGSDDENLFGRSNSESLERSQNKPLSSSEKSARSTSGTGDETFERESDESEGARETVQLQDILGKSPPASPKAALQGLRFLQDDAARRCEHAKEVLTQRAFGSASIANGREDLFSHPALRMSEPKSPTTPPLPAKSGPQLPGGVEDFSMRPSVVRAEPDKEWFDGADGRMLLPMPREYAEEDRMTQMVLLLMLEEQKRKKIKKKMTARSLVKKQSSTKSGAEKSADGQTKRGAGARSWTQIPRPEGNWLLPPPPPVSADDVLFKELKTGPDTETASRARDARGEPEIKEDAFRIAFDRRYEAMSRVVAMAAAEHPELASARLEGARLDEQVGKAMAGVLSAVLSDKSIVATIRRAVRKNVGLPAEGSVEGAPPDSK